MLRSSTSLLLGLGLVSSVFAQEVQTAPLVPEVIPGSYIIRFQERSFDLEPFRSAILGKQSSAQVAAIVASMERQVLVDQAGAVREIEALGGKVDQQWWIINGLAASRLDAEDVARLQQMPNVAVVEPMPIVYPTNTTARNATHHNATGANARTNAQGQTVTGQGVAVAIIDTGVDAQFNATGKPNPGYYIGGNQNNTAGGGLQGSRLVAVFDASGFGTEDSNGHGTHVSGSVGSDTAGTKGIAHGAQLVGIRISGSGASGSASGQALINAWQTVATQRAALNIKVANNSFSGSSSLTDSIQVALDNTAFNADVLICCAAGNNGSSTSNSQNTWNGLAVGSINKNTLTVSSFSGTGPLDGFGRTYPDITAVGASVVSMVPNSTNGGSASGTSMASPMVAGGGALVRQAVPAMTALEAKATLLNTTKHTQTSRNTYGLGVMDCDRAVREALQGDFFTTRMLSSNRVYQQNFSFATTGARRLTATWMHPGGGAFDNVDLRVFDGTTLVASDLNTLNSYGHVEFTAQAGRTYVLELTWVGTAVRSFLDVAVAGISATPPQMPTLTNVTPTSATNASGALITLDGTFDRIDRINLGVDQITSFNQSATQITFNLPVPAEIGAAIPVSVTNAAGTSNTLNIQLDGTHPIRISGAVFAVRNLPTPLGAAGDANWDILWMVSPSNQPSAVPGIANLGIGDNFQALFIFGGQTLSARGAGNLPFTFPATVPTGLYYFQGLSFNPANLVVPLEASNVVAINVF
jgi:subtilisin